MNIPDTFLRQMVDHAEKAFPNECVGFVLGLSNPGAYTSTGLYPTENSHPGEKKRRFLVGPEEYMKAEALAIKENTELIGIYHSHPNHPAIPSEEDQKYAIAGMVYPILSIRNGIFDHLRVWLVNEDRQFEEISFNITK